MVDLSALKVLDETYNKSKHGNNNTKINEKPTKTKESQTILQIRQSEITPHPLRAFHRQPLNSQQININETTSHNNYQNTTNNE